MLGSNCTNLVDPQLEREKRLHIENVHVTLRNMVRLTALFLKAPARCSAPTSPI